MTPGERLRAARANAGLSVEQLASKAGRAASTVRASENGQNGLGRKAAQDYARALRVSPEWLLFGSGEDDGERTAATTWRKVPIANHIDDRNWREADRLYEGEVGPYLTFPDGLMEPPDAAFTIADGFEGYRRGELVFTAEKSKADLRSGDHVVLRYDRAGFAKVSIASIRLTHDGGAMLIPLATGASGEEKSLADAGGESVQVLGIVVGTLYRRDRPPIDG